MTPELTVTVVVVCRDRWSLALETLHTLLTRTDPRHEVVVAQRWDDRRRPDAPVSFAGELTAT